jgi:hypothetical protein
MNPVTAALLLGGANFLGGLFGGAAQGKMAKQELALKAELGRRQLGQNETQMAPGITHSLENSGLRDKTLAMLSNRAGMTPQAFRPTDILNPSSNPSMTPQMGGIDFSQLGQMNSGYKPGDGGVNPDMYRAMLARLGFMDQQGNAITNQDQSGGPPRPPVAGPVLPFGMQLAEMKMKMQHPGMFGPGMSASSNGPGLASFGSSPTPVPTSNPLTTTPTHMGTFPGQPPISSIPNVSMTPNTANAPKTALAPNVVSPDDKLKQFMQILGMGQAGKTAGFGMGGGF